MPDLSDEIAKVVTETLRESSTVLLRGVRIAFLATRKADPETRDQLFLKFLTDLENSQR